MTRSRRSNCSHGEDAPGYPVRFEPGYTPQDRQAVRAVLRRFADVLAALPGPFEGALTDLTADDVELMLRRLPLEERTHALRPLGLRLAPRNVGQALCRDVLARLHRTHLHDALHAASVLAYPPFGTLADVAREGGQEPDPRTAQWSDQVLRFALWACLTASASGARILLWAGTQPWWLPQTLSDEHGKAVLASAQEVVDATPDFGVSGSTDGPNIHRPGDERTADDTTDGSAAETVRTPYVDAAVTNSTDPALTTPADEESTSVPTETAAPTGTRAVADIVEVLRGRRAEFDGVLAAARAAAGRIHDALDAGAAVDTGDLTAVAAVRTNLEELGRLIASADPGSVLTADVFTVAAVDAAIDALEAIAARDAATGRLTRLRHLECAPGAAPIVAKQVEAVAVLAEKLLAGGAKDNTRLVDALLALAELVDIVAVGASTADPQQLLELQTRAAEGLPASLAPLSVSALTGQLLWVSPPTAQPAAPETGATLPVAEPPNAAVTDTTLADGQHAGTRASTSVEPARPAESAMPERSTPIAAPPIIPAAASAPSLQAPTLTGAPRHAAPELVTAPDPTVTTTAALIVAGRFGLAVQIATAAGWPLPRRNVLRLAALADAVRTETGPCAARLRAELATLDVNDLTEDSTMLPLAVAALLRTALVVGEPTTGALLTAAAPHLEPHLSHIAEQVGRRALHTVFVNNPLRTVLADMTELEARLRNAQEAARERLQVRTLRFKRATDVARRWLAPAGLLGRLLTAAVNDVRANVSQVASEVVRLSDGGELSKEIDKLDLIFKGSSGKPIEGAGRQDLVSLATGALAPVSAWLEAVGALERIGSGQQTWATAEIADMREAVRAHAADALAVLADQSSRPDPLAGAAAAAARDSLDVSFALLEGAAALPPGEASADLALSIELLKVPGATVELPLGLVSAPAGTPTEALIVAAGLDWRAAFDAQVAAENFPAAAYMLSLAQTGRLPSVSGDLAVLGDDAETLLTTAEHHSRTTLAELRTQLLTELRRARLQNEVSEEQDGELTVLLDTANPDGRRDLFVVRRQLREAAERLPRYRDEAARRLLDRLETLTATPRRIEVDDAHIRRLIDTGQLSTAEELIYFCEIGEPVPTARRRADLDRFFPIVANALPDGLTTDVIDAVRVGAIAAGCDMLDFAGLSPTAREVAADALHNWRLLGATPPEGRSRIDERASLLPALRLAGLEATKVNRLNLQKGKERRFIELADVTWNGKPMVPQFGSKLGGRLRVLLVWGQPDEDTLMSWVDHDTSGGSVLVAYFGTMSANVRRGLAARAVRSDAPVAVLDDAALAYLAAHGSRQLDATMAVTLPFSAVKPYVRHKRSLVAPEMFYGRHAERKAVLDPDGTQVIFGGRGLGKSALLRDAKAAFESERERKAIHIELTTADIWPDKQAADAVWDVLLRDLEAAGVVPTAKAWRRGKTAHEMVRAGVLGWLKEDTRRRLLILLDESDGFFETDAPRFLETNRLKELGLASEGRAKVVFAGLHSVQRFAKTSNNTFKHLAQQPTVIGPLPPQFAYNLIAQPMEMLGYIFADDDLVNRILGYCSYQPFLLQMFGHRLVEHLQAKRSAGIGDREPPFIVTLADVEAVEDDPELRADITGTFRDTLNLDPRYNVIANVLAHHAYEFGMDARLSDVQLRNECLAWWQAGFATLDIEGFRAYLHEMVGLGVLAPNNDGRGWHLRSPNVLRMIGSNDDAIAELVDAEREAVPSEFIALSTRRLLSDGITRSPLTAAQIDDLLGDHVNQVRVVLGSPATGVTDVAQTLRDVCADLGGRYTLIETRIRKAFDDALEEGRPGERRVVLSDLIAKGTKDEGCVESLEAAIRPPQKRGVTRSVVMVAGPDQMRFWQEMFTMGERPGLGVVKLRRHDRRTLKVWSVEAGRFGSDDRQARLLEVSGGWPMLVERAVALAADLDSEEAALEELAGDLASPDGAARLVEAVGLIADDLLAAAFDDVAQLVGADGASIADLIVAAGYSGRHPNPEAAVACLDALGVFSAANGEIYQLEPLVLRCWPYCRRSVTT